MACRYASLAAITTTIDYYVKGALEATIAVAIANSVADRCYGAIEPIATLRGTNSDN
ncbi:hypothetical protein OROGR_022356 [Orobanche gracilis]